MLVSWVYVYKSKIDTYICTARKDMLRYVNIDSDIDQQIYNSYNL